MSEVTKTNIVFPVNGAEVLLAMKARGFGANWWNGFGGKLTEGETFEQAARRETKEEIGLTIGKLRPVAKLLFFFGDKLDIASIAYVTNDYQGEPTTSEEMRDPTWFGFDELPYKDMWPGDDQWIPQALALPPEQPPLELSIFFDANNNYLKNEPADPALIKEVFG